ncbi:MAG: 2-vinyl bacteriochlorophyllide hydratase [Pseudomonadota bacterium]
MTTKSESSATLYTPEQRARRDATRWTLVQGVLAPLQFGVFLVSVVLVVMALDDPSLAPHATLSVIVKTLILYTIMITGSLWEKAVFGQYLFVRAFFWEDVVSMLVLALHTAYLLAVWQQWLPLREQLLLALAAYAAYVVNAAQFLLKLRKARLTSSPSLSPATVRAGP